MVFRSSDVIVVSPQTN